MTRPDMSRINLMLIAGVVFLAVLTWATRFSPYTLEVPHHKEVALGLYCVAAVFALLSLMLHAKRTASPWKTSAASVSLSYILFFLFSMAGILVHRLGM